MINGNTAAETVPATCLKSQNNMSLINHHSTGLLDSGDEISLFFFTIIKRLLHQGFTTLNVAKYL